MYSGLAEKIFQRGDDRTQSALILAARIMSTTIAFGEARRIAGRSKLTSVERLARCARLGAALITLDRLDSICDLVTVVTGPSARRRGGFPVWPHNRLGRLRAIAIHRGWYHREIQRASRAASLNPKTAKPPATTRPTQLTQSGTDQSPITIGQSI
jgi:hypothetical protein